MGLGEVAERRGEGTSSPDGHAAEPEAALAQETVGPAASSAPLSRRTSGSPSADTTTGAQQRATLGPTATAPEPARTMTYDECVKGPGSDTMFHVKSPRFAVCNGASCPQKWTRNGQPFGTSMFHDRVVDTIARNSRTITFQHYFTDFTTAAITTSAAAMPITTSMGVATAVDIEAPWRPVEEHALLTVAGERHRQVTVVGLLKREGVVPHIRVHALLPDKLCHEHPFGIPMPVSLPEG